MITFKKFPSIVQFNNVVKSVRQHCKHTQTPLPKIKFSGSVKLHGTNGAIGYSKDGELWFQSRERVINYESDNAGFATWGEQNLQQIKKFFDIIIEKNPKVDYDNIYIYGEWCCGNIQKGVALNLIEDKKFAIFQILMVKGNLPDVESSTESEESEDDEIVSNEIVKTLETTQFHTEFNTLLSNVVVVDAIVPPLELVIDFNNPSEIQNFLLEKTLAVEKECPFGKYFGVSGVGEGVVYTAIGIDGISKFKIKGEKHSSSRVKTVRELTDAEIASKANAKEFVEYALTENRLKQGIDKLREMGLPVDIKSTGSYLKWIGADILKECHDVLIESKIDRKDVMAEISNTARQWFLTYIQNND